MYIKEDSPPVGMATLVPRAVVVSFVGKRRALSDFVAVQGNEHAPATSACIHRVVPIHRSGFGTFNDLGVAAALLRSHRRAPVWATQLTKLEPVRCGLPAFRKVD